MCINHQDLMDCQTGCYVTSLPIWPDQCAPFTMREGFVPSRWKEANVVKYQKYILFEPSKLICDRFLSQPLLERCWSHFSGRGSYSE